MSLPEQIEAQHHADNQRRLSDVESQIGALMDDMGEVKADLKALSIEFHASKGTMAANTAFTQETLAGIDSLKAMIGQLDIPSIKEIVGAVDKMKGGITVLGWIERPAKWFAVMAGAFAAGLALWVKWKAK